MQKTIWIIVLVLSGACLHAQQTAEAPAPQRAHTAYVIYFDESMPLDSVYALQNRFNACISPSCAPLTAIGIIERKEWKTSFIFSNGQQPWKPLTEADIQAIIKECNERY